MIKAFTKDQWESTSSREKLPLKCVHCGDEFHLAKNLIQLADANTSRHTADFCSRKCANNYRVPPTYVSCKQCEKEFKKRPSDIKKSKSGNHFCSKSCAGTWNNKHRKHGSRRSKLEIWIEARLTTEYKDWEIHFNRKDAIGSELDIYIPHLSLAFELNGIFHYEPIFGEDKLKKIQNNDERKFQACLEKNIELVLIDASNFKNFKENKALKYLNIITEIVDKKCGDGGIRTP